jgi:tetratricopeptide (TPR) repeat protein
LISEEAAKVQIKQEALALVDEARSIAVRNDEEFQEASEYLRTRCKAMRKRIDLVFEPMRKRTYEAYQEVMQQRKTVEDPIIKAEKIVKRSISAYIVQQEQERRKAEAEARKAAQELAEKEALERAAALEAQGRQEEAEAIIEEPIKAAPVVVPVAKPKAEGISVRKVWKFRVVDVSKVDPKFLIADEKKIGQIVRSMKQEAPSVVGEGIEVYTEDVVAARA